VPSDLLHRVEICAISDDSRELLKQLVREVLVERGFTQPKETGALRAKEAAAYIGIAKTRFYQLIKEDPLLGAASYNVGRSRAWPKAILDKWLKSQVDRPAIQVDKAA
jgi:predicted DNA-binding transcriptional regulator AlpA